MPDVEVGSHTAATGADLGPDLGMYVWPNAGYVVPVRACSMQ